METKLLGLILVLIGVFIIRTGLRYKDSGHGGRLTNINLIGSGLLLLLGGIVFFFTSKSLCEIFGIFC